MRGAGRWPRQHDGLIRGTPDEKWRNVDNALRYGLRSLQGGSSLAQLLAERRGARNLSALPPYTEELILSWVDVYHQEHGEWPTKDSGPIDGVPGETWHAVSAALINGRRGLPGGSSLAQLLASARGVRNRLDLPPFTEEKVLVWVDAYFRRHGKWPTYMSGLIPEATGETWSAVDSALWQGHRGLSGPSSLAQFLTKHRGVRNPQRLPRLTITQILEWADNYFREHGCWPMRTTQAALEEPGTTWASINSALANGRRGLPGRSSLAQLLARYRGVRNRLDLPKVTVRQILAWADAHFERTGQWPRQGSGPIPEAPGESWIAIDSSLAVGRRGLPGGSSLAKLLSVRKKKKVVASFQRRRRSTPQ